MTPLLTSECLDETEAVWSALFHELRIACRKGYRPEAKTIARKLRSEGQALYSLLCVRPLKQTKLERCKAWLAGLLGTVPREMRLVYREAQDKKSGRNYSEKTVQRALKEMGAVVIKTGCRAKQRWHATLPKNISSSLSTLKDLSNPEPPPPEPLTYKPGTPERLAQMAERVKKGQPLFMPGDADLSDREGMVMERFDGCNKQKNRKLAE